MAVGTSVVLDPSNRSEPLKLHVKRIRIPLTALVSQADAAISAQKHDLGSYITCSPS